ncbi:NOC3L protein, partial [Acromyrmex heyeri]
KLKKPKISKIKRNNQIKTKLSKQGKLKTRRHKPKKQPQKSVPPCPNKPEEEEESDHGNDLMDMVEEDDLNFLKNAISNKSYSLLKQIHLNEYDIILIGFFTILYIYLYICMYVYDFRTDKDLSVRKRKKIENDQPLEQLYENNVSKIVEETGGKSIRMLLPIKTHDGVVEKRIIEEDNTIFNGEENEDTNENQEENKEDNQQKNNDTDIDIDTHVRLQLYILIFQKSNIKYIIYWNVFQNLLQVTDRPVSIVELLACREEILKAKRFKIGILSSGILENPELKSENFNVLLKMMDKQTSEVYITIRKLAMVSLLEVFKDLLPSYSIQEISQEGVKLKKDTLTLQKYEATLLKNYKSYLQRLEKISKILRTKNGNMQSVNEQEMQLGETAVSCMCELLAVHPYFNFSVNIANYVLPLLDNKRSNIREKVAQCISQIFKEDKRGQISLTIVRKLNQYIKSRKHSVHSEVISVLLALRIKDINLDKEKEDETKQKKLMSHKQRILALSKRERKKNKKLEQVEKEMLETKGEENKQAKHKILTEITSIVFTIYFRILKQAPNSKVLSVCLEGLAKFAHCININFYQDLVGAISQHNATLGTLGIIKQVMQLGKTAHILLDTDCTGDGHYQVEIKEPDYCNAHCTALYELVALQRHYHSVVRQLAKNIAYTTPTSGEGSLTAEIAKLSPQELYMEYDPAGVAFKPAVPIPKKSTVKKVQVNHSMNPEFDKYVNIIDVDNLFADGHVDFYKACKNNL